MAKIIFPESSLYGSKELDTSLEMLGNHLASCDYVNVTSNFHVSISALGQVVILVQRLLETQGSSDVLGAGKVAQSTAD